MVSTNQEQALISLIAAYLHGEKLDQTIYQSIGVPALLALAKRWSLENIALDALLEQQVFSPDQLQVWQERRHKMQVQGVVQQHEAQELIRLFVSHGLHVLPLKGYYMKGMYPKPEHRQMCDLDFLLGEQEMEQARTLMEQRGYVTEHFQEGNHDNYRKRPFLYVELHRRLLAEDSPYAAGLGDMLQRATLCPGGEYQVNWSDYYLFLLVHFAKHMKYAGSGPRSVLDVYLFLRAHGNQLDEGYLQDKLAATGLDEFRHDVEEMAQYWFAPSGAKKELSERAQTLANRILGSTVYGTWKEMEENLLEGYRPEQGSAQQAGVRYLWHCIFLPRKNMEKMYPVLKHCPALLPACWLVRGVRMVFATPGRSWKNFQAIRHTVQRLEKKEKGK